jgi:hypothetical protein
MVVNPERLIGECTNRPLFAGLQVAHHKALAASAAPDSAQHAHILANLWSLRFQLDHQGVAAGQHKDDSGGLLIPG